MFVLYCRTHRIVICVVECVVYTNLHSTNCRCVVWLWFESFCNFVLWLYCNCFFLWLLRVVVWCDCHIFLCFVCKTMIFALNEVDCVDLMCCLFSVYFLLVSHACTLLFCSYRVGSYVLYVLRVSYWMLFVLHVVNFMFNGSTHQCLLGFLSRNGTPEPGTSNAVGLQRWAAVWSLAVHYMLCIVMPQFALSGLNVMYCLCSMYCTLLYVLSLRCSILLWPAEVAFSFLSLRIYYIDGLKLRMRARFPNFPFSYT